MTVVITDKYGNLLIKFLTKINCTEFTTSYRGFDVKKLNNFHLIKLKLKDIAFLWELLLKFLKKTFQSKKYL